MKRIFSLLISLLLLEFVLAKPLAVTDIKPPDFAQLEAETARFDVRVQKLQGYLTSHNSPLAPYAGTFVEKADFYGLPDWRLVPAIAGVESTFGKRIPHASYNAFGWANGNYAFRSWEDAIEVVTKTLAEKYIARGRESVEEIAPIYAPPSKTWAYKVNFFITEIDKFETVFPTYLALADW